MKDKQWSKRAMAEIIVAGVLWGMLGLFVRRLSAGGLSPLQILFLRLAISAVAFTVILGIFRPRSLHIRWKDIWMFIGTGIVSVVLFNLCYFYAVVHGEISVAVMLLYTSPVFILLISAVIFKEKITRRKLLALTFTLIGSVLTSGLLTGQATVSWIVYVLGVGSGLFYGLYTIFSKFAIQKYSTATISVYTFIFGAVGVIPFAKPKEIVQHIKGDTHLVWWALGIGILCTVLTYFLYTDGLRCIEPATAAILVETEPLTGTLIGLCCFNEIFTVSKALGMLMFAMAVLIMRKEESST